MNLKDLTKTERKHLAETSATGRVTYTDLKANLKAQRQLTKGKTIACWDCRRIAQKLGIDPDCEGE